MRDEICELDGSRVRIIDSGGPRPAIVFCHGNSSSSAAFELLFPRLLPHARILAFDFYGHGKSPPARGAADYSVRSYAKLLSAVVQARNLESYCIVGHSLGGHAALEALPRLGRGLSKLITLSAPPINRETMGEAFADPTDGLIFKGALSDAEAWTLADAFTPRASVDPSVYEKVVETVVGTAPEARSGIGQAIFAGQFEDELPLWRQRSCPVVFVHGGNDRFISAAYYERLISQGPPPSTVRVLQGIGHCPHLEAPELVADLLLDYAT